MATLLRFGAAYLPHVTEWLVGASAASVPALLSDAEFRASIPYGVAFHLQLFLLLLFVDVGVVKLAGRRHDPGHRWFYVHAFGNAVVCFYAVPNILTLLHDPIPHVTNPIFAWEATWAVGFLHLYHLALYKCRVEEWVHHLLFAFGGVATGYVVNFGYSADLYEFFVCGLPGGIDYVLLALVKERVLTKQQRLRVALELNMWLRAPGIAFAWAFCVLWWIYRPVKDVAHFLCFVMITIASVVNGQYYARQVSMHAGKCFLRDKEE